MGLNLKQYREPNAVGETWEECTAEYDADRRLLVQAYTMACSDAPLSEVLAWIAKKIDWTGNRRLPIHIAMEIGLSEEDVEKLVTGEGNCPTYVRRKLRAFLAELIRKGERGMAEREERRYLALRIASLARVAFESHEEAMEFMHSEWISEYNHGIKGSDFGSRELQYLLVLDRNLTEKAKARGYCTRWTDPSTGEVSGEKTEQSGKEEHHG
jgi:hypothetical protein